MPLSEAYRFKKLYPQSIDATRKPGAADRREVYLILDPTAHLPSGPMSLIRRRPPWRRVHNAGM
jgi:hypothetical protein